MVGLMLVVKKWSGFDEDGTPCEQNKSMKMVVKEQMSIDGFPALKLSGWESFPIAPSSKFVPTLESTGADGHTSAMAQEPIPQDSHKEISGPFGPRPMSVDTTVTLTTTSITRMARK